MTVTTALFLGAALGWLAEWLIDVLYFRKKLADPSTEELSVLRDEVQGLRAKLLSTEATFQTEEALLTQELAALKLKAAETVPDLTPELARLQAENAALVAKVQAIPALQHAATAKGEWSESDEMVRLRTEVEDYRSTLAGMKKEISRLSVLSGDKGDYRDDLEEIDGIGPVFERKLYAAGINTFKGLAITSPDRLREIIAPQKWQKIEPEKWIEEAKALAERKI